MRKRLIIGMFLIGLLFSPIFFRAHAAGQQSATSVTVTSAPVVPPVTPPVTPVVPGGGGGGGGGGETVVTPSNRIIFQGRAYPASKVTILKDGVLAASTVAGSDAKFEIVLSSLAAGTYNFACYTEDKNKVRSKLLTFPLTVTAGVTITASGIFIAPTIQVDKIEVRKGENIGIFGQSAADSQVSIVVGPAATMSIATVDASLLASGVTYSSEGDFFVTVKPGADGVYFYNFDTSPLDEGGYLTKSKSVAAAEISAYGDPASFKVGKTSVIKPPVTDKCTGLKGDYNTDCKINLVDFSIQMYWWNKASTEVDLNGDGKVDLVDFSIMLYHWTG